MILRLCPRCNSPNTELDIPIWWGDRVYRCNRCSFRSTLFPEIILKRPRDIKNLKLKKIKQK